MARVEVHNPPSEAEAQMALALVACARQAKNVRLRLRSLAFNPDDDAVLMCEDIEDRAMGVLDRVAREACRVGPS